MGRTNPTLRDRLDAERSRWQPFRHALRRDDREHFDALFAYAREHADAASEQNPVEVLPAVLLAIALGQERRLAEQAERLDAMAERLAAIEAEQWDEAVDGERVDGERVDGERVDDESDGW